MDCENAQRQDAEKYCESCRHVEMCRWYPFEGCEFKDVYPIHWTPCNIPPNNERDVFIAYASHGIGSVCIGYYSPSDKCWREHKNFFADIVHDAKFWCDMPELPDGWKEDYDGETD